MYLLGAVFKFRRGSRLTWFTFYVGFLSLSRNMFDWYLVWARNALFQTISNSSSSSDRAGAGVAYSIWRLGYGLDGLLLE